MIWRMFRLSSKSSVWPLAAAREPIRRCTLSSSGAGSSGWGSISILPASILATSSRSLIRLSRCAPELWMSRAYSQ